MSDNKFNNLPDNQDTFNELIKVINTSNDTDEVFFALIKQAIILYEYEEFEKAILILKKLFEEKGFLEDVYLELLIDSLIIIENKSEALYYINIRKETLSQIEMYKYLLDLVKYKSVFNENYYSLLDTLRAYSFDKSVLIPFYKNKLKDYVKNNLELVEETYLDLINLNLDKQNKEEVDELYFDYLLNNKISSEEFIKGKKGLTSIYFQLRVLMKEDLLKKVQILEAENENDLDNLSLNRRIIIFGELKDFYDKHHDLRSYDLYLQKHQFVVKELKKVNRKKTKKELVFPKENEIVFKEEVLPKQDKPKQSITSEKLAILEYFIKDLVKLDFNLSLFDRIRGIGLLLEEYFDFTDILFYSRPQIFHYKKGRLYSKNYSLATIDSSIVGITANTLKDIVNEVEFIEPNYDLITDKKLTEGTIRQVYSYGVEKGFSITFYQSERKDLLYDDLVFKTLSSIIYYDLKYDNYHNEINDRFSMINGLLESNFLTAFIYKDELIGTPLFNKLFSLKKNDNLSSLVLKFSPELRVKYNNLFNSLKKEEIKSFEIDLHFEGKDYLAKHYIYKGYIYGLFVEITKKNEELELWQEKAFTDPLSKLLTLHEFEVAFSKYIKQKTSFVLIELESLDKIESLYGKATRRTFFLEFVEFCKMKFNQVYHFDQNSILAVLNINDVRTVENQLSLFLLSLKEQRSKILKEQQFNCYMGIIRYPINTKEKNVSRIYQYLSLSLCKAKTTEKNKRYSYFDFADYEQDLFETEIIKQIDNLILMNNLFLNYTQIVNQKTKRVYAYEVGVTSKSLNVYEQYYYQVAEKRDMLERLEKYVLTETFKNLSKIYEEINSYVKLVVNVSAKTLNTPNFTSFLSSLYRTYKIPYEVIEIKVNLTKYKLDEALKLEELASFGVIIGTENLDYLNKSYIEVFHLTAHQQLLEKRTQEYLKYLVKYMESQNMVLIVYNVDSNEQREILEDLGVNYIRGRVVDKEISYQKLIKILKS